MLGVGLRAVDDQGNGPRAWRGEPAIGAVEVQLMDGVFAEWRVVWWPIDTEALGLVIAEGCQSVPHAIEEGEKRLVEIRAAVLRGEPW